MNPIFRQLLLVSRVVVGGIFTAHGYQKLMVVGIHHTANTFAHWGIPMPTVAANYAAFVELFGGLALILGLALPLVGCLLAIDMLGALIFVHGRHGLFLENGGAEYVITLGLFSLLLGFSRGGPLAFDNLIRNLFGQKEKSFEPPPQQFKGY